ncbi:hypothetical protein [Mycobacterium sp. NPDC006124]|uniref:hypothetical protein n=1 Tax=Mycobacterium sp. NPDC006124 TaxID=3156729 RepID=UPI0033A0BD59
MTITAESLEQPLEGAANTTRRDHTVRYVALGAALISIAAYWYFASKDMALGYADSISHLQIASRTLDSPTAGFAQLGGVWLPLPHLLMLPLIWFTPFYYSGFAGSAVSMASYVIACIYVYKMGFGLVRSRIPALGGLAVFALNPNVLYMQSTPMSELLLFATITATAYYVQQWLQTQEHLEKYPYLFAAAVAAFLACLTRYEAWAITLVFGVIVVFAAWRQYGRQAVAGLTLSFGFIAGAAIILWLGWNLLIFGNALNFQNGKYAKPSLWVGEGEQAVGNLGIAAKTYWYAVVEDLGIVVMIAMIAGAVAIALFRRRIDSLPVLGLLAVAPFFVMALFVGQRPLHVTQVTGDLYNLRFGLLMSVPAAVLVAYLLSQLPARTWVVGTTVAAACALLPLLPGGPTQIVTAREGSAFGFSRVALDTSEFLREHYDGGVILIESFGNESILFHAGIALTNNVYEGSYRLWDPALSNPPGQEIKWIVMRGGKTPDQTYVELNGSSKIGNYERVFQNDLYSAYEIKG